MNYLAHLYFSGNSQLALLGNLMGDFVKGPSHVYTDHEIINGIKLHLKIDKFTDRHDVVKKSKSRISSARRRYAGIMVDVFYDHFLAKNWERYSDHDFKRQIDFWYLKLAADSEVQLPGRMQYALEKMTEEDWLSTYRTSEGISDTIDRISRRIRFKNNLAGGGSEMVENYAELEQDFHAFFPQLIDYVEADSDGAI